MVVYGTANRDGGGGVCSVKPYGGVGGGVEDLSVLRLAVERAVVVVVIIRLAISVDMFGDVNGSPESRWVTGC